MPCATLRRWRSTANAVPSQMARPGSRKSALPSPTALTAARLRRALPQNSFNAWPSPSARTQSPGRGSERFAARAAVGGSVGENGSGISPARFLGNL